MRLAKEDELQEILIFLQKNLVDCLYLYIDVKKYGLKNPNMDIWIERTKKEEKISTVIMRYYDSIQMVSEEESWDKEWLKNLIIKEKFNTISGKASMIKQLSELMHNYYSTAYGVVFKLEEYRKFDSFDVQYASEKDLWEIAKLICTDEAFKANYEIDALEQQLRERMNSGMGRNAIIRINDKIISHIATYAEFEDIAITSGMITHPNYRDNSYGFLVESFLTNELLDLGMQVYTLVLEKKRKGYLKAIGAKVCSEYGRMTHKRNLIFQNK